ncbi:peptidase [Photobacterium swingsii]|uniref:Peptidase n=1 Tax=Photobacterium swingsii TaxID=680026 RepID=A0A0J8V7Y1_9GAMM|nr:murein L,D-transpeptidase catalytic domain family protein [Photobacterium swingsii]KMV28765.1 peptidase [Photobacterium swingsii]PSW25942.1 peptidase [Photobacterium swingsii]
MKRFTSLVLLALWFVSFNSLAANFTQQTNKTQTQDVIIKYAFKAAKLENIMDYQLFKDGYLAYDHTKNKKKSILTIIDYSKPSTQKRFYVIDLKNNKLLYHTYVTHGVNSGGKVANRFSNVVNSKQTSLGTFLTDTTYQGGNGYSLKLDGLTKGINDNARRRYIVIHGADYANESFIKRNGYLGRSWGCPALPKALSRSIINTIKGGSVIYAHA